MKAFELASLAFEARENSYSPYSNFMVGAALLGKSGKVYLGCNVENAAYGETMCAERTALFKAVSQGEREFLAIAIVGGKNGETSFSYCYPCGACRQALSEFVGKDFMFIFSKDRHPKSDDEVMIASFEEILPFSFEKTML